MNDTLHSDEEADTEQVNIEGLDDEPPFVVLEKPQEELYVKTGFNPMKPRDCDVNISSKAKSMLQYISTTI